MSNFIGIGDENCQDPDVRFGGFVLTFEELNELRELARRKIAKNKKLARRREKENCRRNRYE